MCSVRLRNLLKLSLASGAQAQAEGMNAVAYRTSASPLLSCSEIVNSFIFAAKKFGRPLDIPYPSPHLLSAMRLLRFVVVAATMRLATLLAAPVPVDFDDEV